MHHKTLEALKSLKSLDCQSNYKIKSFGIGGRRQDLEGRTREKSKTREKSLDRLKRRRRSTTIV
jgi:hypothetical protein